MNDLYPVVVGEKYLIRFTPGMIVLDGEMVCAEDKPKGPSVLELHNGHMMTVTKYDPPQYSSDRTGNASGQCKCGQDIPRISTQFLVKIPTDIYANGPLCECLGSTPKSRVLMFFIANPNNDYTKTEVAHATKMARQTVYAAIDSLERFGLIEVHRKIGNTRLYHRKSSKATDSIINFNETLVSVIIEEEKAKMKKDEKK